MIVHRNKWIFKILPTPFQKITFSGSLIGEKKFDLEVHGTQNDRLSSKSKAKIGL